MYPIVKRFFDVLFSLLCLVILSPLFFLLFIPMKLTGEGYIFYLQKRLGLHKKVFNIYKFATMLKDSPNLGTGTITLRNDPRVTPVGKYLRITKINELPQILNVLFGQMSFVGPRPLVLKSFNLYTPEVQTVIYNSRPGITGIGSIIFRDEEKFVSEYGDPHKAYEIVYAHKGNVEVWYQKNKSFTTDFLILFITGWQILFSKSQMVKRIFKDLPTHEHF
jgi:lipopolysaccharide/colanic/teichoic acid biosynthesis glycosyltransferase